MKISPDPFACPTTGKRCQRGGFLPFVKGGQEGFSFRCLYNDGVINKNKIKKGREFLFPFKFLSFLGGANLGSSKIRLVAPHAFYSFLN
jgi:hypothetical protein